MRGAQLFDDDGGFDPTFTEIHIHWDAANDRPAVHTTDGTTLYTLSSVERVP